MTVTLLRVEKNQSRLSSQRKSKSFILGKKNQKDVKQDRWEQQGSVIEENTLQERENKERRAGVSPQPVTDHEERKEYRNRGR